MNPESLRRIAVSTSVLAAMAVSGTAIACPLGVELQLDDPSLTWSSLLRGPRRVVLRESTHRLPPVLASIASVGDGDRLVHAIAREGDLARCGTGHGEIVVRVTRRHPAVTVSGFDPVTTSCITHVLDGTNVSRISEGTLARIAIELR